ncbi:unnamed protein product [Ascophyllum nodosum]
MPGLLGKLSIHQGKNDLVQGHGVAHGCDGHYYTSTTTRTTRRTRGSLSRSPGGTWRRRALDAGNRCSSPMRPALPSCRRCLATTELPPRPGSREMRQAPSRRRRLPCESFLGASGGTTFLEPR